MLEIGLIKNFHFLAWSEKFPTLLPSYSKKEELRDVFFFPQGFSVKAAILKFSYLKIRLS